MEIHNVSGCTSFSLNIDGKEEIELTDEERLVVIDKIHDWMKQHPENLNIILQELTSAFGEYNSICDIPCEMCGDIVDEYVLTI